MKIPPPPWWLILVSALVCAIFAGMYAAFAMPGWITGYAFVSAAVLFGLALHRRGSTAVESNWEYGRCHDRLARRHKASGEVQFILWKAGQQGHAENYWHRFDPSWWPGFVSGKAPVEPVAPPAASAER